MKKKILFIISNLQTGGVSKALTSLMNIIDHDRYDVSLMIVSPTGPFMELLPSNIHLIINPVWSMLTNKLFGSWQLLKSGHPVLAVGNCIRLVVSIFSKAKAGEIIATLMPAIYDKFDTIVDFNGQQQLYYMIKKLNAKKKVTFFHSDYEKWPYYFNADKKYFPLVDHIFSISPKCVDSLKKKFPSQAHKIGLMENISSLAYIQNLSKSEVSDMPDCESTLLTIGHVCENKGILWAIDAARILKRQGLDFHWYFIGSIDNPEKYARLIADADVTDRITFLGIRINPYPYMQRATIIVHPSKFEGRSIALDEARLLCKPIVVTAFSTVNDQFTDGFDASICDMNSESIATAIGHLMANKSIRDKYSSNLLSTRADNSNEIKKLYSIFDD